MEFQYCQLKIKAKTPSKDENSPKARTRMIKYRDKITGTMVFPKKGIMDHFAKIDENTMLGVMDMKGGKNPYFFVLERDSKNKIIRVEFLS